VVPALQLALNRGACENLLSLTLGDSLRGRNTAETNHAVKLFELTLQHWRFSLKHLGVNNNRCVSQISTPNIKNLIQVDHKKREETSSVSVLESLDTSMEGDAQCVDDVTVKGRTDVVARCFPNLHTLNLRGCNWPDAHIPSVLNIVSQLPFLRTLSMKDNRFTSTEKSCLQVKLAKYHPKLRAFLT
jgi:hypothetical protein